MDKKYLNANLNIKGLENNERVYTAVITSGIKDRHGETVNPDGWRFDNFLKNPVLLFAHKYDQLPVGKVLKIYREGDSWLADFVLAKGVALAEELRKLIEQKILLGVSVGFRPLRERKDEKDPYDIMEQELYELSLVPVPANPDALIKLGYNPTDELINKFNQLVELYKKELKEKEKFVVCGDRNLPIDDEASWDGNKARDELEKYANDDMEKYKKGFVIRDENSKENKTAYKLPFARVKNGKLVATWGGVMNAMKAVLGARAEMKIPEETKKSAYNFLADYYKKFDKEVPEYKSYTDEELKELFKEEKVKEIIVIEKEKIKEIFIECLKEFFKEKKEKEEIKDYKPDKIKILNQILYHVKQADKNNNIALMKFKILNNLKKLAVKNSMKGGEKNGR